MKTKTCPRCEEDKPLTSEHYYPDPSQSNGFHSYCIPCRKEYSTERNRKYPLKSQIYNARSRAKKAGVPFEISEDEIEMPTHCPVLGIPLVPGPSSGTVHDSPSLDRLVPSKGYVPGNVRVISQRANKIKSDATLEELEALTVWLREELN